MTHIDRDARLAGSCFFLLGAGFLTITMLAASIAPGYDFHGGAISDLGVIDSTAALFNVLLVAIGLLNAAGGWLLFRVHGRAWILAAYLGAAVGAIGAGVFPLDTGGLHSLFALLAFVAINLEALATATVLRGALRAVSVAAGLVGLAFVVVMVIGDSGDPAVFGAIGHGGTERLIAYPAMLWLVALGGWLVSPRDQAGFAR
jgi:hypothetical membrane protein